MTEEAKTEPTTEVKVEQPPAPPPSQDVLSPEAKRILKKEREEARVAERKRVEEEYGVPAEEAKRIIAEAKKREEAQQSEAERAQKEREKVARERDTAKQELESAYAHIAQMTQENVLRSALVEAGINPKRLKIALRSADMDLLDVDGDGNVSGAEDAIAALKEESPEWFGAAQTSVGGGSNPANNHQEQLPDVNPYKAATFNLTQQAKIERENPDLARRLENAAKA